MITIEKYVNIKYVNTLFHRCECERDSVRVAIGANVNVKELTKGFDIPYQIRRKIDSRHSHPHLQSHSHSHSHAHIAYYVNGILALEMISPVMSDLIHCSGQY